MRIKRKEEAAGQGAAGPDADVRPDQESCDGRCSSCAEDHAGPPGLKMPHSHHRKHSRNRKKKGTFLSTTWFFFVICVFNIMLVTSVIMVCVAFFMLRLRLLGGTGHNPFPFVSVFLITSVILGTVLSLLASRKLTSPFSDLNRATKAVAKGDFSVRVRLPRRVNEVREMLANFNLMVQELGSIETLRNDFIVNVSHEFKTPIAAIEGYAELLRDMDLTKEEQDEYTKKIIDSARQLSSLAENILKISKLENQEIVVEKEVFSLDEQIRQTILLLEQKWSEKNLDLDIDLNDVFFYGSSELLIQVWINLLINAIKFTPKNGTITVKLTEEEGIVNVTVADTGVGIEESELNKIFEKFYQSDSTRGKEGNGLGLTLVKRIVDLSGGEIFVESRPGEGAAFTVILPNEPPEILEKQERPQDFTVEKNNGQEDKDPAYEEGKDDIERVPRSEESNTNRLNEKYTESAESTVSKIQLSDPTAFNLGNVSRTSKRII